MASQKSKSRLLWLDLEMTGLNPEVDLILEVASIITDFNFESIVGFESKVEQNRADVEKLLNQNPFYSVFSSNKQDFIDSNDEKLSLIEIETRLLSLLDEHCLNATIYLAGNSIYNDRKFISKYMPKLDQRLHYRMLDVSAFKILMQEKYSKEFSKANQHRAMSDVQESIDELKYYIDEFNIK